MRKTCKDFNNKETHLISEFQTILPEEYIDRNVVEKKNDDKDSSQTNV